MTWKEFQEQTKQITDAAAEKLGTATDLAVLRLQLRTEKTRLRSAYEDFGEIAYLSFTSEDEDGAEALAEYIKAITLIREQIAKMNRKLVSYKQIRNVEFRYTEFEKTTSKKIKRHLVR